MTAMQPTMASTQVEVPPIEPWRTAADELEGRSFRPIGRARWTCSQTTPRNDEQPAERDDERRHADVGDDEALERPDRRRRAPTPRARAMTHVEREVEADARGCVGNQSVISRA